MATTWPGSATAPSVAIRAWLRCARKIVASRKKKNRRCWPSSSSPVQEIIPLYRRLMEREQIELSTTPFFHPILPLLIDTDFTHRARPDLPLPSRFHAPDDAEAQLQRAVEFHTATFGRAPVGLWPSEGSVCPELIPMLPKAGLRWLATDEVHPRSLAQRGPATVATPPGSVSALPGRAGGPRRHDAVSRSGDLRCLWLRLPQDHS